MSFKELTKYRMQFLKVLSEKEFSLDFHIFAMEAVQDAQYISEEDAENVDTENAVNSTPSTLNIQFTNAL